MEPSAVLAEIARLGGRIDEVDEAAPGRPVVAVEFVDDRVADADLACLAGLPQLAIADAGLEHLQGLIGLVSLDLSCTGVTGVGFQRLRGLTRLQSLCLWSAAVTDEGLGYIAGMTSLRVMVLHFTPVTDKGLRHRYGMTHLQGLALPFTKVTADGIRRLKEVLPQLQVDV